MAFPFGRKSRSRAAPGSDFRIWRLPSFACAARWKRFRGSAGLASYRESKRPSYQLERLEPRLLLSADPVTSAVMLAESVEPVLPTSMEVESVEPVSSTSAVVEPVASVSSASVVAVLVGPATSDSTTTETPASVQSSYTVPDAPVDLLLRVVDEDGSRAIELLDQSETTPVVLVQQSVTNLRRARAHSRQHGGSRPRVRHQSRLRS